MTTITLTQQQIEDMIEAAATRAAKKALADIGLHDEAAGADVREMRSLVQNFRDAKRTILQTILKWGTMFVIGILIAWYAPNQTIIDALKGAKP